MHATSKLLVVTVASPVPVLTTSISIDSIRWVGGITAGHKLQVTDMNDLLLFKTEASGANYVEESSLMRKWTNGVRGIKVPVLDSGVCHIYYSEPSVIL